MTRIVLAASIALMIGFELLAEPFLALYLGHAEPALVNTCRLVFLAALPFAFFNGMRSVLDAYYQTPRNGVNLMVALAILLLGGMLHLAVATPWYTIGVVSCIALGYLGWATWRDTRYVRSELLRLAARSDGGTNVLVVIPDAPDAPRAAACREQAMAMAGLGARINFFQLEHRTSPLHLLASRRRFKRILRSTRPDVVHVHFGSVTALWTVLSSPLPVVVTFSGDALARGSVPGGVRARLGGLFSQLAAFFAAGIICTDEDVRDQLWWRTSEAHVMGGGPLEHEVRGALAHLRAVALHKPMAP